MNRHRPVEAEHVLGLVRVVADVVRRGHHELARKARIPLERGRIEAIPEPARVALVDRRRPGCRERPVDTAGVAHDRLVEEDGVLGDVDVLAQRLDVLAEVVLADVEGRAPHPVLVGQRIRHEDLVEPDPVDDRANRPLVLVADLIQDKSLAGGVADPHLPALPGQLAAVEPEARPVRLPDDEIGEPGLLTRSIARGRLVHRDDPCVAERDDLFLVHVDRHVHTLDRAVVHVRQIAAEERDRAHDPGGRIRGRVRVIPRSPHVEVDVLRGDAAVLHRLLEARVGANDPVADVVLRQIDRRLDAGARRPGQDLRCAQVDDDLDRLVRRRRVHACERAAHERLSRRPRCDLCLRRFLQRHDREGALVREPRVCLDHVDRLVDLGRAQRVEWM